MPAEPGNSATLPLDPSRADSVREQLDRVLSDAAFAGANRRSRLLRYLVEETLEDRAESLKESVIATEVFDRAPDYDPQIDSVVRVEVGRLRARLAEYYDKAGDQPVRIEIPKGGYRPVFVFRDTPAPPEETSESPASSPAPAPPRRNWTLPGIGIALLILAAAAFLVWRARSFSSSATPETIAVMPFLNLSGNPGDEYLSDGISEELTEALAESGDLRVVARTSAFQYKGKAADVREIGRNLRAGALIEGSIMRREGQLRVIAQLIRTSDGYHLWSHTYDAPLSDLERLEAGIVDATRKRLAPASSNTRSTQLAAARNPEAHDLYIRAVYEFNRRTVDSTRQAMDLAKDAAAKDPSFAQPYVLMASGESQLNTLFAQPADVAAKHAWEDVGKALDLDPSNSDAHAMKALLAYTDKWDWPQAEREFHLALATGSHESAENLYGWCLMTRGRFAESRVHLENAAELDPLSLGPRLNQVEELLSERKFDDAKRKAGEIIQSAPANLSALTLAMSVAVQQRDCPAATALNQKFLDTRQPGFRLIAIAADAACGRKDQVAASLAQLAQSPAPPYPYLFAAMFALDNDAGHVMYYLEMSAERHEAALMEVQTDPAFGAFHQHPRFIALVRKLGLTE